MEDRKQTIQDKVQELEGIIKYFEKEDVDLDMAIEKYEKAAKLVKEVNEVLMSYETRVKKIKASVGLDT